MNQKQKAVETCMNRKICDLKECMNHLEDRDNQPDQRGNLYNGMLKSSVQFEITHMEHLRDELIEELK